MAHWQFVSAKNGGIAAASITASAVGSAHTIITLTRHGRQLLVTNDLDKAVMLTFAGADFIELPPGAGLASDALPGDLLFETSKVFGVYHLGVQPTSGRLSVTVL